MKRKISYFRCCSRGEQVIKTSPTAVVVVMVDETLCLLFIHVVINSVFFGGHRIESKGYTQFSSGLKIAFFFVFSQFLLRISALLNFPHIRGWFFHVPRTFITSIGKTEKGKKRKRKTAGNI